MIYKVPNLFIYMPIYSLLIIIRHSFMAHSFHKAHINRAAMRHMLSSFNSSGWAWASLNPMYRPLVSGYTLLTTASTQFGNFLLSPRSMGPKFRVLWTLLCNSFLFTLLALLSIIWQVSHACCSSLHLIWRNDPIQKQDSHI